MLPWPLCIAWSSYIFIPSSHLILTKVFTWLDPHGMIWSTSQLHMAFKYIDLSLASSSCCLGPLSPSPLLALHYVPWRSVVSGAFSLPFTLAHGPSQPTCLDFSVLSYEICHVSYSISSFILVEYLHHAHKPYHHYGLNCLLNRVCVLLTRLSHMKPH
jgi:hypothetical protein